MKLTRSIAFAAAAVFASAANSASANDWVVEPRIQVIETSYMPGRVVVTIDVNARTCAAGAWLTFLARGVTEADRIASTQATRGRTHDSAGFQSARPALWIEQRCVINFVHLL
jgi:hypothetical protein